jgi:hypothetical protein
MTVPTQTSFVLKPGAVSVPAAGENPARKSGAHTRLVQNGLGTIRSTQRCRLRADAGPAASRRALLSLQEAFESGRDRFGSDSIITRYRQSRHLIVDASGKQIALARNAGAHDPYGARAQSHDPAPGNVFAERLPRPRAALRREGRARAALLFGNFAHHANSWGIAVPSASPSAPYNGSLHLRPTIPAWQRPAPGCCAWGWRDASPCWTQARAARSAFS